jgi:hypothetical protein
MRGLEPHVLNVRHNASDLSNLRLTLFSVLSCVLSSLVVCSAKSSLTGDANVFFGLSKVNELSTQNHADARTSISSSATSRYNSLRGLTMFRRLCERNDSGTI